MFHEVAHGLGIKNTINGKGTVREALKEQAGALEEGKADILGLYMVTKLQQQGELQGTTLDDNYVTFLASIFRSVRFGAGDAHGRANAAQFSFFQEHGAFTRDSATGRYRVDFPKMRAAVDSLAAQILRFQGDGDYAGVKRFMASARRSRPTLEADLARLGSKGIPVDVVFEQGVDVLGLERASDERLGAAGRSSSSPKPPRGRSSRSCSLSRWRAAGFWFCRDHMPSAAGAPRPAGGSCPDRRYRRRRFDRPGRVLEVQPDRGTPASPTRCGSRSASRRTDPRVDLLPGRSRADTLRLVLPPRDHRMGHSCVSRRPWQPALPRDMHPMAIRASRGGDGPVPRGEKPRQRAEEAERPADAASTREFSES